MIGSLLFLSVVGLGVMRMWLSSFGLNPETVLYANRYALLAGGGLLGGTVYGGKWLYHAVAKGLWHEDRKLW